MLTITRNGETPMEHFVTEPMGSWAASCAGGWGRAIPLDIDTLDLTDGPAVVERCCHPAGRPSSIARPIRRWTRAESEPEKCRA